MRIQAEVRRASVDDAGIVAALLHDFNAEFDTPTPGPAVLGGRLRELLASDTTVAYLASTDAGAGSASGIAVGVALVTWRRNVWYDGPVALLDELYVVPARRGQGVGSALIDRMLADAASAGAGSVEIGVDEGDVDAQRFYRRHGFDDGTPLGEPGGERSFWFVREL